jgi:hypothetical protein
MVKRKSVKTKPTGSDCDRNALVGLLDNSLPAAARVVVQQHMNVCDSCRLSLESLKSTLELARSACQPHAMDPFEARAFAHKVRGRIAAHQPAWLRMRWPAVGGGFVSGAVVGALVLFFTLGHAPGPVGHGPSPGEGVEPTWAQVQPSQVDWVEPQVTTLEEVTAEQEWAGTINDYLLDTASEAELFDEMETLIGEEDLYALLDEY